MRRRALLGALAAVAAGACASQALPSSRVSTAGPSAPDPHRSNLVGMGILPLELPPGTSAGSLGLTGDEVFSVHGIADGLTPRKRLTVEALRADGAGTTFEAIARIDSATDIAYLIHGGVLPIVLRELMASAE